MYDWTVLFRLHAMVKHCPSLQIRAWYDTRLSLFAARRQSSFQNQIPLTLDLQAVPSGRPGKRKVLILIVVIAGMKDTNGIDEAICYAGT